LLLKLLLLTSKPQFGDLNHLKSISWWFYSRNSLWHILALIYLSVITAMVGTIKTSPLTFRVYSYNPRQSPVITPIVFPLYGSLRLPAFFQHDPRVSWTISTPRFPCFPLGPAPEVPLHSFPQKSPLQPFAHSAPEQIRQQMKCKWWWSI